MTRLLFATVFPILLIAAARAGEAGQITYTIQNYPADQNGASLTGSITTDGVMGNLAAADILSWTWTVTPQGGTPFTFSSSDADARPPLIDGSVVASQSSITIGAAAPGSFNELRLFDVGPGEAESDLGYLRNGPSDTLYESDIAAATPTTVRATSTPAMGGTDPWVIAMAGSAVPEPSGAVLLSLGIAGALLCRTLHRSNRIQLRELP